MSPVVRRRRHRGWRAPVMWLREKPARGVAAGALAVLAVLTAWTGWSAWSAGQELQDLERSALLLRQELEDGDAAGARRALEDYQEDASSAAGRTDGPTWWVLERVPVVGDDAQAVATAAAVLDDLGELGLPQLVDAADLVAARSFNPRNHEFPLADIAAVRGPARESEAAFDDAAVDLDSVAVDGLSGPVAQRYDNLREIVLDARSTLGSAYRAAQLLPSLLGDGSERDHLLVFENNAELRSLGGLAGSISLVHAEDGEVHITAQEGTSKFGGIERPVVPLTAGEERVFGRALGQWFMNATMTPDVPRAAVLARSRWERELGGSIDGVFFIDPVAVSYLLTATGPVDVPGYGAVTSADVVQKVENQIYLTTSDRTAHEDYQNAVAEAVFDEFAAGRADPVEVIRMLGTGVAEGRIRMHSFVDAEQEQITGTEIAGELATAVDEAHVGMYLNDALESKMTYYLQYEADVVASSCTGHAQEVAGSIHLTNAAPERGLPPSVTGIMPGGRFYGEIEPGQQRVALYLTAPVGGRIESLSLDDRPFDPVTTVEYAGRSVAQVVTVLDPGETQRIDFEMRSGPGQTGPIEVDITPGAFPGSSATTLRSAC